MSGSARGFDGLSRSNSRMLRDDLGRGGPWVGLFVPAVLTDGTGSPLDAAVLAVLVAGVLLGSLVLLRLFAGHGSASASMDAAQTSTTTHVPDLPDGLDDHERVIALLELEGGRLRQSRIVDWTDWSKTKVSRTLSKMAENGEVVKIRLGRENLVCLPDEVPAVGRGRDEE